MGLKRPKQDNARSGSKVKRVDLSPDPKHLARAARGAVYGRDEYHCRGESGAPRKWRAKPASPCPRSWATEEGTDALRRAISGGHVSAVWDNEGFPRYAWHREGSRLYEARHTRGPHGTYHAYSIEEAEAPIGLRI